MFLQEGNGLRIDYPASLYLPLRGGRIGSEWPAGMNRNGWPTWIGIGGRNASEYAAPSVMQPLGQMFQNWANWEKFRERLLEELKPIKSK
jgi:hypothetical protein